MNNQERHDSAGLPYHSASPLAIKARHYVTGDTIAVHIADGVIRDIETVQSNLQRSSSVRFGEEAVAGDPGETLPWIGPGLVDLQVNGHASLDLNTHPLPPERVIQLTHALWQEGVTTYYPTLVTNDPELIRQAVTAIAEACRMDNLTERTIAGIHLEGPFISPVDGARGAHPLQFVIAPDWELFRSWQEAAEGRVKLVTLSPEWPDAPAFIRRCVEHGIVVSIGHTTATSEQIAAAAAAGASMSTHLGNGAQPMLPRHPNYIWDQLAQDELYACVIADGFHVPPAVLKVARKVKGDKFVLVSDAVLYSGMAPGDYANPVMGDVVLTPEGRLHLKRDARLLAGSAQMLTHGIAHLAGLGICTMKEAWDSASIAPLRAMETSVSGSNDAAATRYGLTVGASADLVLFERGSEGGIAVKQTYKHGVQVYCR